MKTRLKEGDRVELASEAIHGTVVYVDDHQVRVKWDNFKNSWLYWDRKNQINAYSLLKLRKEPVK